MTTHISKLKTPGKALLLAAVYALHLLFFQVLLAAPGNVNVNGNNNFKPLFTHNHETQAPVSHTPKHPAATYFSMLTKQGSSSMHSVTESPEAFVHVITIATLQIIEVQQFTQLPYISIHQSENLFELYRLVGKFLI